MLARLHHLALLHIETELLLSTFSLAWDSLEHRTMNRANRLQLLTR